MIKTLQSSLNQVFSQVVAHETRTISIHKEREHARITPTLLPGIFYGFCTVHCGIPVLYESTKCTLFFH